MKVHEIMARYLIIAASSGIGQSAVKLLKQQDDEVVTTARSTDKMTPAKLKV